MKHSALKTTLLLPFVLAGVLTLPLAAQENGSGKHRPVPRVVVPEPVWDFGTRPQFTKMDHKFLVRNEGDADLQIIDVQGSCVCQAVMPEKKLLKPSEETMIRVTFDSKSMSGKIHKPVTVKTNDPVRPTLQLMVMGRVMPPFWLSPSEINLGTLEKHQVPEPRSFSIIIAPKAQVEIKGVEATSPLVAVKRLDAEPVQGEDGSREIRFQVGLKGSIPVGLLRERVIVRSDIANRRTVTMGVNAEVKGEISVKPRTFRLGRIRKGETASRTIHLVKSGKPDLVIEELTIKPAKEAQAFSYELITVKEGSEYDVKISVQPDARPGYHRGRLVILTNCPGERVHQAYFYVSIRG